MPSISTFNGITIYMYFLGKEHHPPHIHAYYNNYNATLSIRDGKLLEGYLPKKKTKICQRWIKIHRKELLRMWKTQKFKRILPISEGELYVS